MRKNTIPRRVVRLALAIVVGIALVATAGILDESFGWADALGFGVFLATLGAGFITTRFAHRYQDL